jgi:hypothetical protein
MQIAAVDTPLLAGAVLMRLPFAGSAVVS